MAFNTSAIIKRSLPLMLSFLFMVLFIEIQMERTSRLFGNSFDEETGPAAVPSPEAQVRRASQQAACRIFLLFQFVFPFVLYFLYSNEVIISHERVPGVATVRTLSSKGKKIEEVLLNSSKLVAVAIYLPFLVLMFFVWRDLFTPDSPFLACSVVLPLLAVAAYDVLVTRATGDEHYTKLPSESRQTGNTDVACAEGSQT